MFSQRHLVLLSKRLQKIKTLSFQTVPISYAFSNQQPDPKDTYDELVRSNSAVKLALKNLVDAQHLVSNVPNYDPMRKLKTQQETDLKQWEETLIENRVRPSLLVPLLEFTFTGLGFVSGILGKEVASRTVLLIEKVMEEYHDESLRILNEQEIDEKALRKMLCEIRDNGYDITDEMIEKYQIRPSQTEEQIAQVPKFILRTIFDITKKL